MAEQAIAIGSANVTDSTAPKTAAELAQAISDFLALSHGLDPRVDRSLTSDAAKVIEVDVENDGQTSVVVMPHHNWLEMDSESQVARKVSPHRRGALGLIRGRLLKAIEDIPGVTGCGLILDGQGGGTFQFSFEGEGLRIRLDADPAC